jgi:hypothetical protein
MRSSELNSNTDGKGEGFGNKVSIQTAAIVRAAKATGRVYNLNERDDWVSYLPRNNIQL